MVVKTSGQSADVTQIRHKLSSLRNKRNKESKEKEEKNEKNEKIKVNLWEDCLLCYEGQKGWLFDS